MSIQTLMVTEVGPRAPFRLLPNSEKHPHLEAWAYISGVELYYCNATAALHELEQGTPQFFELFVLEPSATSTDHNDTLAKIANMVVESNRTALCWDSNYLHDYHQKTVAVLDSVVRVFNSASAVLIRHPLAVPLARSLTRTPCVEWYDVSNGATAMRGKHPNEPREWIISPTTLGTRPNSRRNAVVNAVVMGRLQIDFPNYQYGMIGATRGSSLVELEHNGGIPTNLGQRSHAKILEVFQRAKLFINLDAMDVGGLWTVDAAACGVPTVATIHTAAGYLLGTYGQYPCDVDEATYLAHDLLTNETVWETHSAEAKRDSDRFSAQAVGRKLMEVLAGNYA